MTCTNEADAAVRADVNVDGRKPAGASESPSARQGLVASKSDYTTFVYIVTESDKFPLAPCALEISSA